MFWVIQNNLYNEAGYLRFMEAIERFGLPHVVVKPVPIMDKLVPADFDSFEFTGSPDDLPEVKVDESGLVVVCGALTLSRIAKKRGWVPGAFTNENFSFEKWREAIGDNLVNYEAKVAKFSDVQAWWNEFFIRPVEDNKAFTGYITSFIEFDIWRKDLLAVENDLWIIRPDLPVMVGPVKEIYNENRFFVVDGRIVTYSQYKLGNRVLHDEIVGQEVIDFAQKMVDKWQPDRAFVIDVGLTSEGMKVIEYNCINSAGFYKANVERIIEAIENMKF